MTSDGHETIDGAGNDVSQTYAAYATSHDEPRFTDWLRARSEPAWTDAVEHRFVRELGAGTLDTGAFEAYLVEDYAFVNELVGAFGFAVGDAPEMAAKRRLVEFLDILTDEENDYFERSFEALGVPENRWQNSTPGDTTEAFVDLLGHAARKGGYAETLTVLVPAEWIYESWATAVAATHGNPAADGSPSAGADLPFYYAEWVDLHAVDTFVEFVDWLRGELDACGPDLSTRRQARVERFFRRTVEYEVAFFDAAYTAIGGD